MSDLGQQGKPIGKSMSMRELYREAARMVDNGIEGYHLVRKYEDPLLSIKSREMSKYVLRRKQLKRGSYLDDQFRARKDIPNVGRYNIGSSLEKPAKKIRSQSQRKTYLDEVINKNLKQKLPAPGDYNNVFEAMGSKLLGSVSKLDPAKRPHESKYTYLDNAEYQATQTPGPGSYLGTKTRSKTEGSAHRLIHKPEYWRQHHKKLQQSRLQKLKQAAPAPGAYDPKTIEFELFQHKKRVNRVQSEHKLSLNKLQRFKTEDGKNSHLGPGKYELLNQWAGKDKKKGILSTISKLPSPSVYYG